VTPRPDLVARLIVPFHRSGLAYMVAGGLAANIYGEPRLNLVAERAARGGLPGAVA
jgi:hypothetical protein